MSKKKQKETVYMSDDGNCVIARLPRRSEALGGDELKMELGLEELTELVKFTGLDPYKGQNFGDALNVDTIVDFVRILGRAHHPNLTSETIRPLFRGLTAVLTINRAVGAVLSGGLEEADDQARPLEPSGERVQ